jgi:hypothetical protein
VSRWEKIKITLLALLISIGAIAAVSLVIWLFAK